MFHQVDHVEKMDRESREVKIVTSPPLESSLAGCRRAGQILAKH